MSDPFLFVSHVSEDRGSAAEVVSELERRGIQCWIAPRDVRPGKPYDDEIAAAIDACAAMLLIFSERCNESEYIRREITVAGEARKLVIPFRIEEAQPKRGLRIRLADLHWIDGFIAREQAIDAVIKSTGIFSDGPGSISAGIAGATPVRSPSPTTATRSPAEDAPDPSARGDSFPPADLVRGAEAGDAAAQHKLGIAYITAPWDKQDHEKAFHWLSKSAKQGHALGQTCLGVLYQHGTGTPRNVKQALYWYGKAADQDYDVAHRNLALMYEKGVGGPADPDRALFHFRKAHEYGHPEAAADMERLALAGVPAKSA